MSDFHPLDRNCEAVVFFHKNCMDGFGAAWAFKKLMEEKFTAVHYIPSQYGDVPNYDLLTGKMPESNVYILDFSFPKQILVELSNRARHVFVLDHHKTAEEDLTNWSEDSPKPYNLEIRFDMNRSGAGLAWDFFAPPSLPRPMMISYIEDRDLWKFKMYESEAYNEYVKSLPFTFQDYDALYHEGFANCVYLGKALRRANQKIVDSIVAACKREIVIDSHRGLACNSFGMFASDVGEKLALECGTFGASYYTSSSGNLHFSLRSRGSFDVSEVAKKFAGGGHKNAAGFVVGSDRLIETAGALHLYSSDEGDSD